MMDEVGIPDPTARQGLPAPVSGGMSQRVMIAMALACNPKLLIADEPTTALDVTIQAQILDLLRELQTRHRHGAVLITHDMGVVAETADRVLVQYAGRQVETNPTRGAVRRPAPPLYRGVAGGAARERGRERRLPEGGGVVPGQFDRPTGLLFLLRCEFAFAACRAGAAAARLGGARPRAAASRRSPMAESKSA